MKDYQEACHGQVHQPSKVGVEETKRASHLGVAASAAVVVLTAALAVARVGHAGRRRCSGDLARRGWGSRIASSGRNRPPRRHRHVGGTSHVYGKTWAEGCGKGAGGGGTSSHFCVLRGHSFHRPNPFRNGASQRVWDEGGKAKGSAMLATFHCLVLLLCLALNMPTLGWAGHVTRRDSTDGTCAGRSSLPSTRVQGAAADIEAMPVEHRSSIGTCA